METLTERSDDWPGKQKIETRHNPAPSERKAYVEQDDWREVCLPLRLCLTY
jgi:hypothetical protein